MPPLNMIKILGTLDFIGAGLKVPTEWDDNNPKDKTGKSHWGMSHKDSEKKSFVKPMNWFQSPTSYKGHVKSAEEIGGLFKTFAENGMDAVKMAHSSWKMVAKFKDLKVMAVCAIGTPGCLDGPELKGGPCSAAWSAWEAKHLVKGKCKDSTKAYIKAVKEGISGQFKKWQDKVMIPGLPFYPAFATFPSPSAPPMPNVPMPLITTPSAMMAEICSPKKLADAMTAKLAKKYKDEDSTKQHEALFSAIGTVVSLAFVMWIPMQQIMLVMGKGSIPTFAPPYVPVGPVVGGDNIATPGHLMA